MDIKDIPAHAGSKSKYPWAEWAKIPEGKALEVTEFLNGRTAQQLCAGCRPQALRHGLIFRQRGERVFLFKEKQP